MIEQTGNGNAVEATADRPAADDYVPVDIAVVGDMPATELSMQQRQLLVALTEETDVQCAAKTAGVSRATAYRWLNEPAFAEELARLRNVVLTSALDTVKAHTRRAAAELARLLDANDERVRRMACKDILDQALRIRDMENIERRLAVLEKQDQEQSKQMRRRRI